MNQPRTAIDVLLLELLVAALVEANRAGGFPTTLVIDTDKEVVEALNKDNEVVGIAHF